MENTWILPAYSVKGRSDIVVTISKRNGIPAEPYEIRELVSEDEYYRRMESIMAIAGKYNWSWFERIFVAVVSVATLTVVLAHVFIDKVKAANPLATEDTLFSLEDSALIKARAISAGAMFGIVLLLWVPYFVFKAIGSRRTTALLLTFDKLDAARGLRWTLASVSLFPCSATIAIILPFQHPPSNFHPQAYLPEYMASSALREGQNVSQPAGPVTLPVNDEFYDEKV